MNIIKIDLQENRMGFWAEDADKCGNEPSGSKCEKYKVVQI